MDEKRVTGDVREKVCAQCGGTFHGNFCSHCGAKAEEEITFCPVCGIDREEGAGFCFNCGFSYIAEEGSRAAIKQEPAPIPEVEPEVVYEAPDTTITSGLGTFYEQQSYPEFHQEEPQRTWGNRSNNAPRGGWGKGKSTPRFERQDPTIPEATPQEKEEGKKNLIVGAIGIGVAFFRNIIAIVFTDTLAFMGILGVFASLPLLFSALNIFKEQKSTSGPWSMAEYRKFFKNNGKYLRYAAIGISAYNVLGVVLTFFIQVFLYMY